MIEFQSYLSNGLAGAWDLLNNLCLLLFLFTIPWLARKTTQWIIRQLDFYRAKVLKFRFRKDQMNYRWALRIQRATPYIPLLLYIVVLEFVAVYIEGTFYGELRFLLPLLRYYLVYKVFRLAIEDTISLLQGVVSINPTEVRRLVDFTSKLVGRFYLISFSTMALTVATVDKGLIYNLTSIVLQGLGLIVWALAIHRWKGVLSPAVKSLFPGKIGQFLEQQCLGRFSVFYCLPTFILVFVKILIGAFWDIMEEWEVTKIFFAKIYRRRVEALDSKTSSTASEPPPDTYSKLFSLDFHIEAAQTVDANAKQLEQVKDEIRKWLQEDEGDQSLVIYGEKGIGKTSFMKRLSQDFQELDHYFLDTPAKTLDLESLNSFISDSLGLNSTESLERKIMNFNHGLEKKVIIFLDNAHNLFLGEVGGFVALKALIDLVNLDSKNIFWCVSFNEFSWSYLKGVLGNAEYFRTEVYLNGWSDLSIRKLIMSRHSLSKYKLSFDRLVLALRNTTTQTGAIEYAEEQFFRLLWEQSRGNPRVALHLWVRSLTLLRKDNLKVNLPERIKTDRLKTMDDNVWFILAAVTNHENASRGEIADATNLNLGTVNHAIKLVLEERFLHRDHQRRYRLGLTFQHDLIKSLKEKNFIYGLN
ncbi:AAA family ATPase [Pseudobacteriovorax antillogorgiicola]|uniref:AAA domain-containing protein n=1 Tax=Pseudobacteriovorax antillogorgiicola TaxID=1513793 RepID=A0A1Y6B6L3_9BACT|nr:AAA family ATPase [Pseudobacteriovorax antillogorgiicola]TCS58786.1 AAA domain-containing protein [Pseudobacteriovorax antillogorgiicola]SME94738.1 AAA domain-containing protein [Pseudobacteriovorax antillogorgiicola]